MERALSGLVRLATKPKYWSVVASIGISSSALEIWRRDNILVPLPGMKELFFMGVRQLILEFEPLDDRVKFQKG